MNVNIEKIIRVTPHEMTLSNVTSYQVTITQSPDNLLLDLNFSGEVEQLPQFNQQILAIETLIKSAKLVKTTENNWFKLEVFEL